MSDVRRVGGLSCAEADEAAPAFVLGALEPEAMAAVREHLAGCPEAHETFDHLGGSASALSQLVEPVEPPVALKTGLMAAVNADLASQTSAAAAAPGADAPAGVDAPAGAVLDKDAAITAGALAESGPAQPQPVSLAAERARRRPLGWFVAAAAAAIVIMVLGVSNVALRGELDATAAQTEALRQAVAAVGAPGATVAGVTGTEAQPNATGFVVLPPTGDGYLAMHGLAALPAGQTYEAWTIGGDGVPVPAGLASPRDGLAVFALPGGTLPTAVAVTIEPTGGSQTPTLPIQAAGEVGG